MKIRIEGCTKEALEEHSDYLTLGKEYESMDPEGSGLVKIQDDTGAQISALVDNPLYPCAHLPAGARWVVIQE